MTKSGLLIASGLSSRISGFKPLLQYEGKSFLITIVEKMLTALSNIVIVVGHKHLL
ncbi:MAG: nucleotidyltransferase family protein, partial [Melioribacteraceae bacterium]|nr:nucleotidyltransferase family protein [Melioribacteraceae bacterium]